MKQEYDFTGGIRGKYYKRYKAGSNIVVLDPEVATVFTSSEDVNQALRFLIQVTKHRNLIPKKRKARKKA